jgi:hypothetical protein
MSRVVTWLSAVKVTTNHLDEPASELTKISEVKKKPTAE